MSARILLVAKRCPVRRTLFAAGIFGALWAAGCELIVEPEVSFLSNRELLEKLVDECDFQLDEDQFQLFHAQVLEDFLLLDYRGVAHPGDRATVRRISRKSTEQNPDKLKDLESFLPILEEHRPAFEKGETREEEVGGARLRYVTYTFEPPIRDPEGVPHSGRGIAGILDRTLDGESVVYWFNLDNWGDRAQLGRGDMETILKEMLK